MPPALGVEGRLSRCVFALEHFAEWNHHVAHRLLVVLRFPQALVLDPLFHILKQRFRAPGLAPFAKRHS